MRMLLSRSIWSKRKFKRIPAHLITKLKPKGSLLLRSSLSLSIIMLYIRSLLLKRHFHQHRELHPGPRMMNRSRACLILRSNSFTMVTSLQCHIFWVPHEQPTQSKVYQESSMGRRQPPRQHLCVAIKMLRVRWSAHRLAAASRMTSSRTMTSLKLTWARAISHHLRSL
jgi:hypothetical protein